MHQFDKVSQQIKSADRIYAQKNSTCGVQAPISGILSELTGCILDKAGGKKYNSNVKMI